MTVVETVVLFLPCLLQIGHFDDNHNADHRIPQQFVALN